MSWQEEEQRVLAQARARGWCVYGRHVVYVGDVLLYEDGAEYLVKGFIGWEHLDVEDLDRGEDVMLWSTAVAAWFRQELMEVIPSAALGNVRCR